MTLPFINLNLSFITRKHPTMRNALTSSLLTAMFTAAMHFTSHAQGLSLQWANAIAGTDPVSVTQCAADAQGNIYVVGSFQGTADFDPGPGTANLTASSGFGMDDAFLAKYDAQGNYMFAFKLGTGGNIIFKSIAINSGGDIITLGTYYDATADFDPGTGVLSLPYSGSHDIFVARYDANGNLMNAFGIGGTGPDKPEKVSIDASDNIYICGAFRNTVDFDPGPGTTSYTCPNFLDYGFYAKYTASGSLVYASSFPSSNSSFILDLAIDAAGNVYAGGVFQVDIDVDPGAGVQTINAMLGLDGFWAKYDVSGNYLNSYSYNGGVNLVLCDAAGNFYVSGRAYDTMDMDPGPAVANIVSQNSFDIYFARYDANGNYLNAHVFESNATCIQNAISTNGQNALYMAGRFPDTMYCQPGNTTTGALISNGGQDGFICKFDVNGAYVFAHSFGDSGGDYFTGLYTDDQGNVWTCGYFEGTVDMDPGSGTVNIVAPSTKAGFIAKYTDGTVSGIAETAKAQATPKIYSAKDIVIVDFTQVEHVNAAIRVTDVTGRTVLETTHQRSDRLRLDLSQLASQLYVVIINNEGSSSATKLWVE